MTMPTTAVNDIIPAQRHAIAIVIGQYLQPGDRAAGVQAHKTQTIAAVGQSG